MPGLLSANAGYLSHSLTAAGSISGRIMDAESNDPVSFAYIHLEEINRTSTSDRNGRFEFRNVPSGTFTLTVHRIGYVTQKNRIEISDNERFEITVTLQPTVISGESIEVIADADQLTGSNLEHASIKVTGDELRQDLGTTLSETLSNQPGFSQRTMGAAPGRPVIRGLGDQRVLILQDGERTGDVSWTSSDHAVSLDPSTANEIEIARGPAALEYGSNAIGGVINVVKNQIPNSVPTNITGVVSMQGASVNRGLTGAGSVTIPWNDIVLNLDLNGRTGQDFESPIGTLTHTHIRSSSNAFGASYIRPWGYAGLSGSMYFNRYGIPPDPVGGHEEGVDIEMTKYQVDSQSEILLNDSFFNLLELRGSFTSYQHQEIESDGLTGTEYGVITTTGSVKARHDELLFFDEGVVGLWGEHVDYAVFGSRTPNSNSTSASMYALQESDFGFFHLETGFRFDYNLARPEHDRPGSFIGYVRERSFYALTTSLSAIYDFGRGYHLGTTLMHSFRPPSLEELYSEGPHLAAYSFEIGNPDLGPERGLGSELFARYRTDQTNIELSGYYNHFNNYIYPRDTGQPNHRRPNLNNWQYVGARAALYGVEFSSEFRLVNNFRFSGSYSFTIGFRDVPEEEQESTGLEDSHQPLPLIPPMKGNIGIHYVKSDFSAGGRVRLAARQGRVAELETPTPGYAVVDLNAQYRFDWGDTFHTLTLNLQNLMNEEYYNHLSRIKHIFPEHGRSVNLLYRVYF
ncbi:MAG: TonB-dependent receptor [Balneolaceae bacterium]